MSWKGWKNSKELRKYSIEKLLKSKLKEKEGADIFKHLLCNFAKHQGGGMRTVILHCDCSRRRVWESGAVVKPDLDDYRIGLFCSDGSPLGHPGLPLLPQ